MKVCSPASGFFHC